MVTKLAVIGANGKIATYLVKRLSQLKEEFETVAFIRDEAQAQKFKDLGIKYSTEIDLTNTSVGSITNSLKPFDAVVFSAGAGGKGLDLTLSVDLDGAIKISEAIQANNSSQRFILVSAIKSQDREFWWNTSLRSYYIAKKYADEIIHRTDTDWTILQPGYLKDIDGAGTVFNPLEVNDYADQYKETPTELYISRDDVALAIIESLRDKNTIKKFIPLIRGDIPIKQALKKL